jgi:hypothetical protein
MKSINHDVLERDDRTIGQGVHPHRATLTRNFNSTRDHGAGPFRREVWELLMFPHKIRSQLEFSLTTYILYIFLALYIARDYVHVSIKQRLIITKYMSPYVN